MTKKQLTKLFTYWTDKLRLDNWDLTVQILPEEEYQAVAGLDSNAHVQINFLKYKADVFINEDSDDTVEYCIVHELVHILLCPFENYYQHSLNFVGSNKTQDALMGIKNHELEKAVHATSRALLYVKYPDYSYGEI